MSAFQAEVFEDLHGRVVARLASGGGADAPEELFEELRKHRESLARPLAFRGREDTVDLPALARHVASAHTALASEMAVRVVDEVSRTLRLHQQDCCVLAEHALGTAANAVDLHRRCAAIYYRECHFLALCLHDMAQGLGQTPPDRSSVAFFGMLGGPQFVKALLEALGSLCRDLATERTGDQVFLVHAGSMIQLLVETLLAYFFAFKASAEEVEQVIALLPHVVMSQHVPLSQAFTVSDLDMFLREEHAEISTKLCLALLCMIYPQLGEGKLDVARMTPDVAPGSLRIQDLAAVVDVDAWFAASPLGAKIRAGGYWNEDNPLGRFMCFAVNGVLLDDESALRNGFVHWHTLRFILHDVLLSSWMVGESCTRRIVFKCAHELLSRSLLPVGRRWVAIRKLEAQAVNYRMLAPDALQVEVLQTLNRLCRVHPAASEAFRDIALHCAETFHPPAGGAAAPPGALGGAPGAALGGAAFGGAAFGGAALGGALFGGAGLGGAGLGGAGLGGAGLGGAGLGSAVGLDGTAQLWGHGAARDALGQWAPRLLGLGAHPAHAAHRPPDGAALYAEILDFLATVCARGSLHSARLVCQRLVSHSNQWFNWGFLVEALSQAAWAPAPHLPSESPAHRAPVVVSLCHLVSAVCGTRLWVSRPPPQASLQALQVTPTACGLPAEGFASLMAELLGAHPEPAVKAACLGALARCDLSPPAVRQAFASVSAMLPTLLAGLGDARSGCDGALAIELLACAVRLVESVPLNKGRYALDLQQMTHVVIHHVIAKVLTDALFAASPSRYWRLASLTLRWLRVALRGPLPLGASAALNASLTRLYADSDGVANDVAMCTSGGNATSYVIRCFLTLDSPVFARVMYLLLLRGHSADGLLDRRKCGASHAFMEQTVQVGLDILRILLQRDVLFCRLYGQHAADRAAGPGAPDLHAGGLLLTHRLLLAEFPFAYPPPAAGDAAGAPGPLGALAGRRLGQRGAAPPQGAGLAAAPGAAAGGALGGALGGAIGAVGQATGQAPGAAAAGVARPNPSYFALLLEYAGVHGSPEITRLALFAMVQCSLREPASVLRILQLEPWRLESLCADLYHRMVQPEEESVLSVAAAASRGKWDAHAEREFMFEAMEMDAPPPGVDSRLDVVSFRTGLPVCHAVDVACQFADDALVQAADLLAWAHGSGGPTAGLPGAPRSSGAASADAWRFGLGYLRGLGPPVEWLGPAPRGASSGGAPPPALAGTSCRLLALRGLALLLAGGGPDGDVPGAAPRLAQVLLGLDPDAPDAAGDVDVHAARCGQPSLLDAVMELLESPPPRPAQAEAAGLAEREEHTALRPHAPGRGLTQAVDQHSSFEVALGVVLSLLASPPSRDVALRYVCYSWPSRYQVLRSLFGTNWLSIPLPLVRVMLSELVLLLQVITWEMRSAGPAGLAHLAARGHAGVAHSQRLEMRRAVGEHLREAVQCLMAPSDAAAGVQGAPSFLIAASLRLVDACDALHQPDGAETLSGHHVQAMLQASSCSCLAPSPKGCLAFCLDLHDPYTCFLVMGDARPQAMDVLAYPPGGGELVAADASSPSKGVCARNRAACTAFLARGVWRALGLFFPAALMHLDDSARSGCSGLDSRNQCVQASLESLLPTLAGSSLRTSSAGRLEFVARLTATLVATLQQAKAPAPLAFVRGLYAALCDLALHPAGTWEARRSAHQALLLVVQRMLPEGEASPEGDAAARLERLVPSLLDAACAAGGALPGSAEAFAGAEALSLLAALLARLPASRLGKAVGGPAAATGAWPKVVGLFAPGPAAAPAAGQAAGAAAGSAARPAPPGPHLAGLGPPAPATAAAVAVAAVLCRDPGLASALFEAGGLGAALAAADLPRPAGAFAAPAPAGAFAGAPAADAERLAAALAALQLLVAVVASLPAHQLALLCIVQWLERNQRPLAELVQCVIGLQMVPSAEIGQGEVRTLAERLVWAGAAGSGAVLGAAGAGAGAPGAQVVLCAGGADQQAYDAMASRAPMRTSRGGSMDDVSMTGPQGDLFFVDDSSALSFRCVALLVQLWVLLQASPPGEAWQRMRRLEPALADALGPLLAHLAAAPHREPGAAGAWPPRGADGGLQRLVPRGGGRDGALLGSRTPDAGRLALCLHLLQAWRCDATSRLLAAADGRPGLCAGDPGAAAAGPPRVQEILPQVWSRAGVLCACFVQACAGLLSAGGADGVAAAVDSWALGACATAAGAGAFAAGTALVAAAAPERPPLVFPGTCEQYRLLVAVAEASLELLRGHLAGLRAAAADLGGPGLAAALSAGAGGLAGAGPAAALGPPRQALVLQHLRALRGLATAAGGPLAPVPAGPRGGAAPAGGPPAPTQVLDLRFAACIAEQVEEMLLEFQGF